jgi:putative uncharacterized protein (fragment)
MFNGLDVPNEIIYADSVQFDIHKDSVFICILSENDNNFETRYGVLTPKLEELHRILLNHNTTKVTVGSIIINCNIRFSKTQVHSTQNTSTFESKRKCVFSQRYANANRCKTSMKKRVKMPSSKDLRQK